MQQKQKKLVLIPCGWLGNRIRAISAAYAFAKSCNRKLQVIWIDYDQGMRMPFSKTFAAPNDFEVIEIRGQLGWFLYSAVSKLAHLAKLKRLGNYLFRLGAFYTVDEEWQSSAKNICIETDSMFFPFEKIPLTFNKKIREMGDTFLGATHGNYVGMHIRRGNNPKAIKNSPTELFINRAKEEIYTNNKAIFLCTDDAGTKEVFRQNFGERVYTREVVLDHSKEAHFIDAAIDLYCLSKAQKIYGSYYSSFTSVSPFFNCVPLVKLQIQ